MDPTWIFYVLLVTVISVKESRGFQEEYNLNEPHSKSLRKPSNPDTVRSD